MTRRARSRLVLLLVALGLFGRPACAAPFLPGRTVLAPAPASGDFFAGALAASGATVVVGARFTDAGASNAGAAYAFALPGGSLLASLANPSPAAGAQFGAAVAVDAGIAAVAAPHAASGSSIGVVYLFDAASGALLRTITNPTPSADDLFGYALAMGDGRLVVGAPFSDLGAEGAGAVHVFDATSGALLRTIANPDPGAYDLFGQAVLAPEAGVLVGAPFDDDAGSNAGAAYLFDASTGDLLHTFTSPRAAAGGFFGSALAALGDVLAIGAPFEDTTVSSAGVTYLFDAVGGALLRTLVDPSATADERSGSALAARDGIVLVGVPLADEGAVDTGAVRLFDVATGDLLDTLVKPAAHAGDQFGGSLAAAAAVGVGAWLDGTAATNAGALYLFTPTDATTTTTTAAATTTTTDTTTTTTTTTDMTTTTTTDDPGSTVPTTTTTDIATSTTTSSASSSSSSTEPLPASTTSSTAVTSTTFAPLPPAICDDGDACTVDRIDEGGTCRHTPVTGAVAVTCRLDRLDALLRAAPASALGGRVFRRWLEGRASLVRRLVGDAHPRPARRLRRAAHALAGFLATVRRAERRGRMLRIVGDGLVAVGTDAARALDGLTGR